MIHKIKLVNWRSHENSELDFTAGTNALLGIMGSGKSSVLQAIVFALYGDTPEIRERKIKLDELIMFKPQKKSFAQVELVFGAKGTWWKVKRRLDEGRGTTYAELRRGDKLVESGPAKVTKYITDLLGVNFDLFTRAVYAKQNEIDYFLTLPKGKRMEKIDELLRLDKLEDARQELSSAINKLRGSVEALENILRGRDKEALSSSLKALELELQGLNKQRVECQQKVANLRGRRDANQQELDEQERKKMSAELLEREYFALDKKKAELSKKMKLLEMFSSIHNPHEKLNKLKKERSEAESKNNLKSKLEGEKSTLEQRLIKINLQLQKLQPLGLFEDAINTKTKLENDIRELKSKLDALNSKLMESKYRKLEGELSALENEYKQVQSKLKTCKSDADAERSWSELDKSILEVESSFRAVGRLEGAGKSTEIVEKAVRLAQQSDQQLRQKIAKYSAVKPIEAQFRQLQEREIQLKSALSRLRGELISEKNVSQELETKISELKSELENKTEKLLQLQSDLEKMKNKKSLENEKLNASRKLEELTRQISELQIPDLEEINLRIEQAQKAMQYFELRNEYASTTRKINETETKLHQIKFDKDRYNALKNEKLQIIEELSALNEKLNAVGQLASEKEKLILRAREDLKDLEKSEAELQEKKMVIERAQILSNALKDAQQMLRVEFLATVNTVMTSVWDILYPYEDYPHIRLHIKAEGSKKGDYNLELQDKQGRWVSVDLVSGGERSMSCLALRIAFAKVLVPSFRLLVLDEPTHNLDSRGVDELANALRDRVSELVDQVLVITHDEHLEKAVTGSCYKLKRDKRLDGPTTITQL